MNALLTTKNLTKRYPGVTALNKITFTLESGAILGLLGHNGSGKSTFMRIASGQTRQDAGDIFIKEFPPGYHTKSSVSYVPEFDHLYNWMSIKECLDFFSAFYPSFQRERTLEMLEFMQLSPHRNIGNLSRGLRTRLKLVMAFSWDAELILLDEPFSGIDPASREKIIENVIMNFNMKNKSIIIATHLVNEVETLLNRVILLRSGSIITDNDVDELRTQYGCSMDQIMRRELI